MGSTPILNVKQLHVLLQFELVASFDEVYVKECPPGVQRGEDPSGKLAMVASLQPLRLVKRWLSSMRHYDELKDVSVVFLPG